MLDGFSSLQVFRDADFVLIVVPVVGSGVMLYVSMIIFSVITYCCTPV